MKKIICTLAVAASLCAGRNSLAITAGHSMLQDPEKAGKNPAVQNADHGKGDPIPSGPDAVTSENSAKNNRAWFIRTVVDEYNKGANPDPKVAAFLGRVIDFFCFPATGPVRGDLEQEANDLEKSGVNDPIFQLLSGMVQIDADHQFDLYTKSLAALQAGNRPKYLQFLVSVNLGKKLREKKAPAADQDARDKASLDLLRDSLGAGAFTDDEMPVLAWQLIQTGQTDLFKNCAIDVCAVLRSSPKVKPWVVEYFEGWRHILEAWKARGTGDADTVTEEGWQGFNAGIAEARSHLVKSWELNPKNALAASEMIVVATAEQEETDTMRKWFDRAVAAEMDNPTAYNQMLWGLEPRWLGTHEEMLRFGEECMKTGRYDTMVPYTYVEAVFAVAEDEDDGGKRLMDPQTYKNIQVILASYLANKNCPIRARFLHTAAAFMYFKAGKLDEAKQHLEAIDYNAVKAVEYAKYGDVQAMVKQLRDYKPKGQ